MQHWELTHAAHKTQTYNICMTKHPYSTRYNTNRKHNIHHIPYTNIQHSTLQGYSTNIPRLTRRTKIITNKSPFLKSYLHKVDAKTHPSPLLPLCSTHIYNTHHLFNCTHMRTTLSPLDLWTDHTGVKTCNSSIMSGTTMGSKVVEKSWNHVVFWECMNHPVFKILIYFCRWKSVAFL